MPASAEIKIDKNIPVPGNGECARKYPFNKLEIGDSFAMPGDVLLGKFRSAAWHFARTNKITLSVRKTDSGYRCWRTA